MRKMSIISVSFASLLLSGCLGIESITGSNDGIKVIDGYKIHDDLGFKILVPDGWEISKNKDVVVAFRNNVRNPVFTANVVVVKNTLPGTVHGLDYAKALNEKVKKNLSSFQEVTYDETQVRVGEVWIDSLFTDAQGREGPDRDLKRFMHLSGVSGSTAYVVAGSMLVGEGEDTIKKMETMIRSFEVE